MRNEIFAQDGYKCSDGREMDKLFPENNWYSAQHDNVNDFLTKIERENIRLILETEHK